MKTTFLTLATVCMALATWAATSPATAQTLFPPTLGFDDFANGSAGILVNGAVGGDQTGSATGFADVNGDGFDDLLIGSEQLEFDDLFGAGGAYVVYGPLDPADGPVDLRSLFVSEGGDGSRGFVVRGNSEFASTGVRMGSAGDFNDDGIEDFYIATSPGPVAGSGLAVFFGRSDGFPAELDVLSLAAANGGDGSAGVLFRFDELSVVARGVDMSLSDFNGDGVADLLYATSDHAYVIFGRPGSWPAEIDVSDYLAVNGGDGSAAVALDLTGIEGFRPTSMSHAGDVNGDGLSDLLIADTSGGVQFVVENNILVFGWSDSRGPELALSSLLPENGGDGTRGTVLRQDTSVNQIGSTVGGVGDINDDGIDDFALGAPQAATSVGQRAGRVWVVFGQSGGLGALLPLSTVATSPGVGFVLDGQIRDGRLGALITEAGDLNGDGIDDLVLPAPKSEPADTATVWTVFGPLNGVSGVNMLDGTALAGAGVLAINVEQGNFGEHLGAGGDLDGDGTNDLAITSRTESNPPLRPNSGRVYVLWGRSDDDGDGVAGRFDNCSQLANADQIDADNDGFGNACDADLDNNCVINVGDLGLFRSVFFTDDPVADFNGDGNVGIFDLGVMRSTFFGPPGPSGLADCDD